MGVEPSAVVIDNLGKKCYISDMSERRIYEREMEDKTNQVKSLVEEFDGQEFLGPYALSLSEDGSTIRFTSRLLVLY